MLKRPRVGGAVLASVLLCAAAAPRPSTSPRPRLILVPPNGTYEYALARNGTDQGSTTVVVLKRPEDGTLETDEVAQIGAARARISAGFGLDDLALASYVATYQAPFPATSPIGAAKQRLGAGFYGQATVRVHVGPQLSYTVDGAAGEHRIGGGSGAARGPRVGPVLFDAPFMTGPLLVPAIRHAIGTATVDPFSIAIDDAAQGRIDGRIVPAKPLAAKTPHTDEALEYPGVATIWFDPHTAVAHEVYFEGLNLDAHLVSYKKATVIPPFDPEATPSPNPQLPDDELTFPTTDDITLSGILTAPPNVKEPYPAVVLVAPPWPVPATRNFGGDGPEPMFPSLARTFAARGYAVLRYDERGTGKSGGSAKGLTWQQSIDDAQAAISAVREEAGIDKSRVFVLGYGYGADIALAAASDTAVKTAGVVALEPSVVSYRVAEERAYLARAKSPEETAAARKEFARFIARLGKGDIAGLWLKTALDHDPTVLDRRAHVAVFVLHSGVVTTSASIDDIHAFDDRLREANPFASVIVANDLSSRFGGRYDADAPLDTEAIFPYRFDASTAGAIADWLGAPKVAVPYNGPQTLPGNSNASGPKPPPPPPPENGPGEGFPGRMTPAPRVTPTPEDVEPGQIGPPSTPEPTASPDPT